MLVNFQKDGHTSYCGDMLSIITSLTLQFVSIFKNLMEIAHNFLSKYVNTQVLQKPHLLYMFSKLFLCYELISSYKCIAS